MDSTRHFAGDMASRLPSSSRRRLLAVFSRLYQITQPALRIASAIAYRFASRQFIFTLAAVSLFGAKLVHITAYFTALSGSDIQWGLSFFAQDTAFILFIRLLLDYNLFSASRWLSILVTTIAFFIVLFMLALAATSISFFAIAGSELHWRNAALASDSSSWKLLLTGLFSFMIVVAVISAISWVSQDIFYFLAGLALDILKWPFAYVLNKLPIRRRRPLNPKYAYWMVGIYVAVAFTLFMQVALYIARPHETSLVFMSWTLPLLPFVDFARSSSSLAILRPLYGSGINFGWDNRTALAEPIPFPWLPKETLLEGFQDWYEKDKKHYRASDDPLKISNLEEQILPELREAINNMTIRHVVLIKLESTRKDVFPFKKDSFIWNHLVNTFENKTFPDAALERLSTLTKTANFLTGDYNDGFEHKEKKRRGGINANQVHTTATYTLKSLTGTLCGLSPLVADFNAEVTHHIYQPCLPHIFEALNHNLDRKKDVVVTDDFTSFKWKNWFMQSVTNGFDHQDQLMLNWGFPANNTIYKEYLQSEDAKFGVVDLPDVNYYGMAEVAIEDYVRDAFKSAKENNERVFMTHLTSTTHHPFGLPEGEEIVDLTAEGKLDNLSKYVNAVGFVDRWLQKVLDVLDEQGVADETLVVFVGDHGLSVAENDGITPYYNPNIGNFHVPLVLSHPSLPAIDVNDAVVSYQILPTILDMLLETGSLSRSQTKVAEDLVRNYEGQSLIRPLINFSNKTGQANWQVTVMNPGRATVAVRDARQPHFRLTVPIIENTEWRFTDLDTDLHEESPLVSFSFVPLLRRIEHEHSLDAAKWAEEAAFIARWWVEENSHRWRYDPSKE
ncbi:hypothetical protein PT974_06683 [Cladobotryum mycophilum]|uniref:Sulfatase N-terminal domain-containing protein n=1 Tax=Cladobotryum mycophilum TaxID=491253 RepID=A0ABR0SMB8_9HYPO